MSNRIRYRKDDPLRYLHVPRRKRKDDDEGRGTDARDDGDDADFDRDEVRNRGGVVGEAELQ